MKKVLFVSMGEEFGGIEKLELEYLKNLNKDFEFDYLTPVNYVFKEYKNYIKKYNGRLYTFNISRKTFFGKISYYKKLGKFLKFNNYDIVHINSSAFFFSFQVVIQAKLNKVKKIIVHSHNTPRINIIKKIFIFLLNPIYRSMINVFLSCSEDAKKSLFSKKTLLKRKVLIIKNGIDIEKYKFNIDKRNEYRKKLQIEDKTVYGNIGRFSKQKNHKLLIDIFYEIQKINKNSILLLIGEGELEEDIKEQVKDLNIDNKVIFLGFKGNAYEYLNCMDIFIFPSLYEGLGIAAIEAQANGLVTYCSDRIPKETIITNNLKCFSLNKNPKDIAEIVCNEKKYIDRNKAYKYAVKSGYDIEKVCKQLKEIYNDGR